MGISALKVRKILISAERYSTPKSEEVNRLLREGKSPEEIQEITGLSRSSVNGYLPYAKGAYNAKLSSNDAQRMKVYRRRLECVSRLKLERTEEALWDTIDEFQNYPFSTVSALPFKYQLKQGRDGSLNKELIVSRRKESKTFAWSSVKLAFERALERQGEIIERPKALGDIRGISYIYPMLFRFGIIEVPGEVAEKMRLKGK